MILADQIEGIARAAIESVVAASREFSTAQHELAGALAEHRRDAGSQTTRLRAQLEDDADGAEAMPRLLLPADMTEASPHSPGGTA